MIYKYRLWDQQCGRYMAIGYNASSKKQLAEEYASYKSNDWDNGDEEEGEETMQKVWDKMSIKDKMDFIRDDEFYIEKRLLFNFKEYEY